MRSHISKNNISQSQTSKNKKKQYSYLKELPDLIFTKNTKNKGDISKNKKRFKNNLKSLFSLLPNYYYMVLHTSIVVCRIVLSSPLPTWTVNLNKCITFYCYGFSQVCETRVYNGVLSFVVTITMATVCLLTRLQILWSTPRQSQCFTAFVQ